MFKIKFYLKSFLFLGILSMFSSSVSAVSVEAGEGTKFNFGGFVNGMYNYQDNAMNRTYKPGSAKRQTSIKDTKARGGFRDETTRLNFGVTRMVGDKEVSGKVEWDFASNPSVNYRVAFISVKASDKLSLTLGRNWNAFAGNAGPYTDYTRAWTYYGGHVGSFTANQFSVKYKLNDAITLIGSIEGGGSDRTGTVNGDYNQQPRLVYNIQHKKDKNTLILSGFYQRQVGARPDIFNDKSNIKIHQSALKGLPMAANSLCPEGFTAKDGFCVKSGARSLFYDGTFNEAYFLYYPQSGVDKLGYDYDSVGYSVEDTYKVNDKNEFTFGLQTGVNMDWQSAQRYSVLDEVNASLIGQYSKIQDQLNSEISHGVKGKDLLGSMYQTKSIKEYHIHIASKHKLSEKLNFSTWIGQSKIMNPGDLKPANATNKVSTEQNLIDGTNHSLTRATSLAYAGSASGAAIENNLFQYTFEYTPFKGEIDNLKFFVVHGHFQTTYANTEVQNNASLAAILPYMGRDYATATDKEKAEVARNKAFENSLRKQAGKTAIANDIHFGASYSF